MATIVNLQPLNTITLNAGTVYQLVAPSAGDYTLNILNGTGILYVRQDADPAAADPASLTVPANLAQFLAFRIMNGTAGIRVLAGTASTISVQLLAGSRRGF